MKSTLTFLIRKSLNNVAFIACNSMIATKKQRQKHKDLATI